VPIALRADFDALQLRAAAKRTKDGPQARRFLALAAIYDGASRTEAAMIGGVTLQIVRDWVLRLNAHGPRGCSTARRRASRPGSLTRTGRRWRRRSRADRPLRCMAWCAGGWSICASGCGKSIT